VQRRRGQVVVTVEMYWMVESGSWIGRGHLQISLVRRSNLRAQ